MHERVVSCSAAQHRMQKKKQAAHTPKQKRHVVRFHFRIDAPHTYMGDTTTYEQEKGSMLPTAQLSGRQGLPCGGAAHLKQLWENVAQYSEFLGGMAPHRSRAGHGQCGYLGEAA